MRLREFPVVSYVIEAGADDRVFDSLLLAGPFVIGMIVVLDRTPITEALAVAYIAVFVAYILYLGVLEEPG